jgi:hypothetical protein
VEAAMTDADKLSIMACMLPHRYFECSGCCLHGGSVESSPPFSGLHLPPFYNISNFADEARQEFLLAVHSSTNAESSPRMYRSRWV